ncbi:MAG: hypothetical protein A2X12_05370 [Bacteroidetes bacterium GWE2_29_8]|nr:MAG: hypothetical protein A2X12_05370 [Bacteroidetes bacterium GWE2_29_8]OFY25312.1 MAG: hypothetical protein A2X02_09895 [Bacteroidetes bacterium GWF2_29_10]
MNNFLVRLILRYRIANIIVISILTLIMLYFALRVQLSYELVQLLPSTDQASIDYSEFKKKFGEDGNIFVVGIDSKKIYELNAFNDWYDLSYKIKKIEGVEEIVSISKAYNVIKNSELKKFEFIPIIQNKPQSQKELDSLVKILESIPLYDGTILNKASKATLMLITLDKKKLNTKNRVELIYSIKKNFDEFSRKNDIKIHYSGLPYIRTIVSKKVEDELKIFLVLSILITSLILYLIFRSFKSVLFSMLILCIGVIWVLGTLGLFEYKITMLTAIIPSMIILIGVENCIFLLNKYHIEIRKHNNKIKALKDVIQRMSKVTLITNATTAVGFFSFAFTHSQVLVEFGIIASLNIMLVYVLTLFLIPIIYSFLPNPKEKHTKHLENNRILKVIDVTLEYILNKRTWIYSIFAILIIIGAIGATKLTTTGSLVDDIPHNDPIYKDLLFFEKHFKGIMPFEISIDTKKKNGVMNLRTIKNIQRLQDTLKNYPELAKPLSVAEVLKFVTQSYFNGNPDNYRVPSNNEASFILSYIPKENNSNNILHSFLDSNKQVTRISIQMANIGTKDIKRIKDDLQPKIDSIFKPDKYNVKITGTSIVFLKGTEYMISNLMEGMILTLIIITIMISMLFRSYKMVLVVIITNLIPQICTAGMMGYLGITIKPSTILIFSISYCLSIDNDINFLMKYRHELKRTKGLASIVDLIISTMKEAGHSVLSTAFVLVLGFSIFIASSFGGTVALGLLISFTLFVAMFVNMLLLPSLILTFNKSIITKTFKEEAVDLEDEIEDDDDINSDDDINKI